jgi:hypothetical protein
VALGGEVVPRVLDLLGTVEQDAVVDPHVALAEMIDGRFGLADVVAPVSLPEFFQTYWEQRPLHLARGDSGYYDGLFSVADLDVLLAQSRPRYPQLRVATKDRPLPIAGLLEAGWASPVIPGQALDDDMSYLYGAYADRYTVIVELELLWRAVSHLCRDIDETLHHKATAELYLTPKDAQGFDLHFDPYEVFILQIEGAKRWQVYEPVHQLPISEALLKPSQVQGPPLVDATVEAGDLLYIPRGFPHQGFTADTFSLHISFGVFVYRWKHLLDDVLEELFERDVRLRESLPIGFLRPSLDRAELRRHVRGLLEVLLEEHDADAALERLGNRYLGRLHPVPDGHFRSINLLDRLSLDSVVEVRAGSLCHVSEHDGSATIRFPGGTLSCPAWIAPTLRFIRDQDGGFSVASLPDELDGKSKLVLVRRLVREGLLRISSP